MNFCSAAGMIILKYFFKGNAIILVVNFWCCNVNHRKINEFVHLRGQDVSPGYLIELLGLTRLSAAGVGISPGVVYGLSRVFKSISSGQEKPDAQRHDQRTDGKCKL